MVPSCLLEKGVLDSHDPMTAMTKQEISYLLFVYASIMLVYFVSINLELMSSSVFALVSNPTIDRNELSNNWKKNNMDIPIQNRRNHVNAYAKLMEV